MQRRAYWMSSDPALNRQFARAWVDPPDEDSRKRSPVATGSADFGKHSEDHQDNFDTYAEQARRAAEALFTPRRAA